MRHHTRSILVATLALALALPATLAPAQAQPETGPRTKLIGRAVLPAETFLPGPTSGTRIGSGPVNGVELPFTDRQPVQGVSALVDNRDGSYLAMSDNGFGSLTNSADYHLRVYTLRPNFRSRIGGTGDIVIEGFIELHDPDGHVPFAITNFFTDERILTGADFDIESMQRAPDGTLWFGDEFGPFLLHTDADGKVLEPPIPLPDHENGREIRSPQNPLNEEASAVRVMNAVRAHAQANGNDQAPVFSPWHVMLADAQTATAVPSRVAPPEGSGLVPASSELFDVAQLQAAGYPVVPYTVNDKPRMLELMELGVDGLISDRPDVLYEAVAEFDADGDGQPGDFLDDRGLIDPDLFDAQGHRGGRDLRPENTLPAMEVGLDNLMSTLETDSGVTADGVPVLDHDPLVQSDKCRRADGAPYTEADEVLVADLTLAELQSTYVCDGLLDGRTEQTNDRALSPVAAAYARSRELADPYVMPSLQQLFDFVAFYEGWYRFGPGRDQAGARGRWQNAQVARFNIETKINPRQSLADRTTDPETFARAVAGVITGNELADRADIQSFDFRTLLAVQEEFPEIRTVYLFGDFPIYADESIPGSDDGTNLQDEDGANTPWLAGLPWPYRVTTLDQEFRAQTSGGFEGMALSADGTRLLPLLEKPLTGDDPRTLRIHEFDIADRAYTGVDYRYVLDERGEAIGDFVLHGARHGLVIERDNTQGDLDGFKAIFEIRLGEPGEPVTKRLVADLLRIDDRNRLTGDGAPGEVGLGRSFAFPFVTIESLVVYNRRWVGVMNDNNFPFSVGRHVGSGRPDDSEFVVLRLDRRLTRDPRRSLLPETAEAVPWVRSDGEALPADQGVD